MLTKLLTPINIAGREVRNRVVMTAMHLNYTPEGEVNDRLVAFYEERARGGTGLIIVGGCTINDVAGAMWLLGMRHDSCIAGHARLAEAIKNHGAAAACQLYHSGRYSHSHAMEGRQAMAPSAVPSRFTGETPKAMTLEEIRRTVLDYAEAASRAKKAGYDMVEVQACTGYLIPQFLSPTVNLRSDEYGGSLANRMRFGLEVADAVRDAVGPDFPVIFRIDGHDFMEGGNTNREWSLFAAALEKHGVDAVDVTGGWHETRVPQLPMSVPRGGLAYLAAGVKSMVDVPVIACNRINDVFLADELIGMGMADMVAMSRALIADPWLVRKAQEGRYREIARCIGCNQGCFDHVFYLRPVTCTLNPRAGMETELNPEGAEASRRVAVVGGGPAGMKAAITAAQRGHQVSLFEKGGSIGGQLNLAAVPPGREEFSTAVEDMREQLRASGVSVCAGREATAEMLAEHGFDAVIVATGASQACPPIPGIEGANVVMAWDVLAGRADLEGDNIVIIGGGAVGSEVAMYVASIGTISPDTLFYLFTNDGEDVGTLRELCSRGLKKVTVVEMRERACGDVGISTRWTLLQDMRRLGIETVCNAVAKRIEKGKVVVDSGGEEREIPADTVIVAVGSCPSARLYEELKGSGIEVHVAGDAGKPRKALDAIREGYEVGLRI